MLVLMLVLVLLVLLFESTRSQVCHSGVRDDAMVLMLVAVEGHSCMIESTKLSTVCVIHASCSRGRGVGAAMDGWMIVGEKDTQPIRRHERQLDDVVFDGVGWGWMWRGS